MKDKNKSVLILSIIVVAVLIIVVVSVTFAYFTAHTATSVDADVNANTDTVDDLRFSVGDDINLTATQFNFAEGLASLSGETTATASLIANSTTNTADYTYNLYLNITSNDYEYTTTESTPEILLIVTDEDKNAITSITGLDYVEVTDGNDKSYSGFDITTKSGIYQILSDYEITSTSSTTATTQTWNIEVMFVNLSTDQSNNQSKSLKATAIIQKDEYTG